METPAVDEGALLQSSRKSRRLGSCLKALFLIRRRRRHQKLADGHPLQTPQGPPVKNSQSSTHAVNPTSTSISSKEESEGETSIESSHRTTDTPGEQPTPTTMVDKEESPEGRSAEDVTPPPSSADEQSWAGDSTIVNSPEHTQRRRLFFQKSASKRRFRLRRWWRPKKRVVDMSPRMFQENAAKNKTKNEEDDLGSVLPRENNLYKKNAASSAFRTPTHEGPKRQKSSLYPKNLRLSELPKDNLIPPDPDTPQSFDRSFLAISFDDDGAQLVIQSSSSSMALDEFLLEDSPSSLGMSHSQVVSNHPFLAAASSSSSSSEEESQFQLVGEQRPQGMWLQQPSQEANEQEQEVVVVGGEWQNFVDLARPVPLGPTVSSASTKLGQPDIWNYVQNLSMHDGGDITDPPSPTDIHTTKQTDWGSTLIWSSSSSSDDSGCISELFRTTTRAPVVVENVNSSLAAEDGGFSLDEEGNIEISEDTISPFVAVSRGEQDDEGEQVVNGDT